MAYLNHAGTSWPKPAPVRAAVERALGASPGGWGASFEAELARLPGLLGLRPGDRLLPTPGCSGALAVAVADQTWERGDRVLCSAFEHHALHRWLVQLAGRGVALGVIPPGEGGLDLERLEAELAPGGVRLVALTAACNVTGELLAVDAAVALAHRYGAAVLVDGAQVAGWMPLAEAAAGADLITFAGHKGPQAPWGIGGLVAAEGLTLSSPAATCELRPPGPPGKPDRPREPVCGELPGYCDVGSVDRLALAGLVAGLEWLAEPERAGRLERARERIEALAAAVLELPGVTLHGPRAPERRMPTLAFTVEGRAPDELAAALAERDVQVSAGLQCAPLAHRTLGTEAGGVLRVSAGPTTTDDDLARAAEALRELLAP